MHRNSRAGRSQRGNILFLILLAVVLFAALSYAVTQSMRGGGKGMSDEDAKLKAAQIIQYATLIEASWQRLRLRGCGIDEISFEHPEATAAGLSYANPRAPSNNRCHMFDPASGGVSYQSFQGDFLVQEQAGNTGDNVIWAQRGHFRFIGTSDHPTLSGSSGQIADTVATLPLLSDEICQEIGEQTTALAPKNSNQAMWSGHLLGQYLHRKPPQFIDLIATDAMHKEGCVVDASIFNPNAQTRTGYWRIISVN